MVSTVDELKAALNGKERLDTLLIKGDYVLDSALFIKQPMVVIGEGNANLNFQMKSSGLLIMSDSVEVQNLNICNIKKSNLNDYAAIHAEDVQYISIHNNRIENAFFGIYFANTKHSNAYQNNVLGVPDREQSTGNAIHLWQCDSMAITANHLSHHRDGIYFEFVTNSFIENNRSRHNVRYGLHFMFSHHNTYSNNVFSKNEAGVAVMYSHHVSMISNEFSHNWGDCSYGLLLKDIYDGDLTDNIFNTNTIAILMEGSNRLSITKNEFVKNGWAIKMAANCEGNKVTQNHFQGNSFDVATNGKTVMNQFNQNYWDQYEGYDLDNDGFGDVPYHPMGLFSVMVEKVPESLMLYRSFLTILLDKAEHVMPSITPEALVDEEPLMKPPKTKAHAAN
ncbi:MAG: nitrous oxide reductase family maturation protein NosD [Bacteroidetes bacterium]|nr:nitrous oxide reductase family maturation protein NosD [Bacteroidota bacterium]